MAGTSQPRSLGEGGWLGAGPSAERVGPGVQGHRGHILSLFTTLMSHILEHENRPGSRVQDGGGVGAGQASLGTRRGQEGRECSHDKQSGVPQHTGLPTVCWGPRSSGHVGLESTPLPATLLPTLPDISWEAARGGSSLLSRLGSTCQTPQSPGSGRCWERIWEGAPQTSSAHRACSVSLPLETEVTGQAYN